MGKRIYLHTKEISFYEEQECALIKNIDMYITETC